MTRNLWYPKGSRVSLCHASCDSTKFIPPVNAGNFVKCSQATCRNSSFAISARGFWKGFDQADLELECFFESLYTKLTNPLRIYARLIDMHAAYQSYYLFVYLNWKQVCGVSLTNKMSIVNTHFLSIIAGWLNLSCQISTVAWVDIAEDFVNRIC